MPSQAMQDVIDALRVPHVYPLMLGTPEAAQATEQTGDFLRSWVR